MRKIKISCVALVLAVIIMIAAYKVDVKATEFKLSWEIKTPMPTGRAQAAIVASSNGKIYVMGGYNETGVLDIVEVYDPLTDTWETKTPMLEGVRGAAATEGPDGLIYVISGHTKITWTPTVQVYNATSDTWSTKANILFPVLFTSAVTGEDGKIYVVGGTEGGSITDKLQIYDPKTDTWTLGPTMPSKQTQQGVVKDRNGFIYSIGGQTGVGPNAINIVQVYDPVSKTWSTSSSMPEGRNEFGACIGIDGNIYAIGGGKDYANNRPPFFNTVMVFNPLTRTWSYDANMPTARKELGAVSIGENIYAIGGCNGTFLNKVEMARIAMPNNVPTAIIDSVTPNPALKGKTVTLTGHGVDTDGTIVAYLWRSSLDGVIGNQASISISNLSNGTHTIYFSVQDEKGAWSSEAIITLTVKEPITDDPVYQRTEELKASINNLTQQLMALGIITLLLIIVIIALLYVIKRKLTPSVSPPPTHSSTESTTKT